jgi:hypothetical protein
MTFIHSSKEMKMTAQARDEIGNKRQAILISARDIIVGEGHAETTFA